MTRTFSSLPAPVRPAGFGTGWCRWLEAAGHRAVAPDLPTQPGTTLDDQVEALVHAAGSAARDTEIVVVAQSLAGLCAPQAAQRLGATKLVLLNAMIPIPGETPGWPDVSTNVISGIDDRFFPRRVSGAGGPRPARAARGPDPGRSSCRAEPPRRRRCCTAGLRVAACADPTLREPGAR